MRCLLLSSILFFAQTVLAQTQPDTVTLKCITDPFAKAASETLARVIEQRVTAALSPEPGSVRAVVSLKKLGNDVKVAVPATVFAGDLAVSVAENTTMPGQLDITVNNNSVNTILTDIESTSCVREYNLSARIRYRKSVNGKRTTYSGRYRDIAQRTAVHGVFAR